MVAPKGVSVALSEDYMGLERKSGVSCWPLKGNKEFECFLPEDWSEFWIVGFLS